MILVFYNFPSEDVYYVKTAVIICKNSYNLLFFVYK